MKVPQELTNPDIKNAQGTPWTSIRSNQETDSLFQPVSKIAHFLIVAVLSIVAWMQYASSALTSQTSPLVALWILLLLLAAWRRHPCFGLPVLVLALGGHWALFADVSTSLFWSAACLGLSWLAWRRHPALTTDLYDALALNEASPAWRVLALWSLMAMTAVLAVPVATTANRFLDFFGMAIIVLQILPVCSLLMRRTPEAAPAQRHRALETLLWWLGCMLVFLSVAAAGEQITFMGIIDGAVLLWPLMIWACLRLERSSACLAILLIPGTSNYMQHAGIGGTPAPFMTLGTSGVSLMPAVYVLGAMVLYGWRCWSLAPTEAAERAAAVPPPFALRPTLLSSICACLTGVAVLAFSVQQAGWQAGFVLDRLVQESDRILSLAEAGLKDMLAQRGNSGHCSEADRAYLAGKARQIAFVRDVGILNGAGEALCHSGEGLPQALLKRQAPEGLSYLIAPSALKQGLDVGLAYRSPGGMTAYALLDIPAISWYLSGFSSQRDETILLKFDDSEIVRQNGEVSGGRLVRRTLTRYAPHFLLEARITIGQRAILSGFMPYTAALLNVGAVILIIVILIISLREQERRARIKARAEVKARSEFLAIMSHEIRTPLNGLLGNLELLKVAAADAPAQPGRSSPLEDACASSRTLLAILNNVLDMSRIDAGRMTLETAPFGLHELVARVMRIHAANAHSKQLALEQEIDPALPQYLVGDAVRIEQILGNLLSNAIKFTPQYGSIVLSIAVAERGASQTPDLQVQFSVQDNGVGIAPEHLQRLCEPFYQTAPQAQGGIAGSGLGLSICKRLVALMGGHFSVSSQPGAGARFMCSLPLREASMPVSEDAATEEATLPTPSRVSDAAQTQRSRPRLPVLIVDDHPIALDLLARQLAQLGMLSVAATGVDEAFSLLLQAGPFAALLTDQNMPEGSGIDLARLVRRHESCAAERLPIILCTADATRQVDALKDDKLIDDVLFKPYTLDELSALLTRHGACGDPIAGEPAQEAGTPEAQTAVHWRGGSVKMLLAIAAGDRLGAVRLLRALHQSTIADLAVMARCFDAADLQGAVKAAHRIKGAARMIGAHEMGAVSERCERAVRQQDWELGAYLLPALEAANQELLKIAAQLDPLSAGRGDREALSRSTVCRNSFFAWGTL
ncbi:response regulator [Herbaspirillum seropedicae]|nr:ATP-binding protein [Herbaspirillum seropedicae]QDD65258.1 response regulator [Herbaspirillum seropedicae]